MKTAHYYHLFPNQTVDQTMIHAKHLMLSKPYWEEFVSFFTKYRNKRDFCNEYRTTPTKIKHINIDRFVHWKKDGTSNSVLTGIGRATSMHWDGSIESLPQGWTGSIEKAFKDILEGKKPNAYVVLTGMVLPLSLIHISEPTRPY